MLPCVTWGLVWLLFRYVFNRQSLITYPLQNELSVYVFDVLWFLKSLFVCILLYNIFKKNTILLVLSLIISQVLPFKVPLMYPCFLVGVYCKKIDLFNKIQYIHALFFLVIFAIAYHFFLPQHLNTNLRSSALQLLSGELAPFITEILFRLYRLFVGIIGSLALISATKIVIEKLDNGSNIGNIAKLGSQTQAIYILHGPIVAFVVAKLFDCSSMEVVLFNYLIAPFVSLFLLIFCYYFINLIPSSSRKLIFGTKN